MRGHFLNYRAVGRLLLFVGIALAVIAATAWLIQHCQINPLPHQRAAGSGSSKSLGEQLAHCQAMGTAAQVDQACIAAWRENRRRFFGDGR